MKWNNPRGIARGVVQEHNECFAQGGIAMKSMTQGPIARLMIRFAFPVIIGNIFQQMYNAVASIIVGRFIGENAFAAVGVAGAIMNLAIFVIVGLCMGAMVLMSEMVGSQDFHTLKRELSSTIIAGAAFTLILSIGAIALTKSALLLIRTPTELIPETSSYLKIIFAGLIFTFLYNIYASAFYAIGDSNLPLIFLMISSVINVILTCLFIIVFEWGVEGAALATVAAQAISAGLCIGYVYLRVPLLALYRRDWILDYSLLGKTLRYCWISAMQQSCVHIGRLLVQGSVNSLGVSAIAAFNAVTRIDAFLIAPSDGISNAIGTFVSQNYGAKQFARIKEGLYTGIRIGLFYSIAMGIVVFFFSDEVVGLFLQSANHETLRAGVAYMRPMAFFYSIGVIDNCFQGYFRGSGLIRFTLWGSLLQILIRVVASWVLAAKIGIVGVSIASGMGWGIMFGFILYVYRRNDIEFI